jgi:low affinity Fe/Cu permease
LSGRRRKWNEAPVLPVYAQAMASSMSQQSLFSRFSHQVSHIAGKPLTFVLAVLLIAVWAISGPVFHYSETWQLVVNTATTIITFLMVFVLQNSQNRDGAAVQAKLDELIFALQGADNRFVGAEQLSGPELKKLREVLLKQAEVATEELKDRAIESGEVADAVEKAVAV